MRYNSFKNTLGNFWINTEGNRFGYEYVPYSLEEITQEIVLNYTPADTDSTVKYVDISPGGGTSYIVALNGNIYTIIFKYNYAASCWTMDISDANGNNFLNGIMLVPHVDLLSEYPVQQALLGSMVVLEANEGDYQNENLLGVSVFLTWFAPGEEIILG